MIEAVGEHIALIRTPPKDTTKGGVILTEQSRTMAFYGYVASVGDKVKNVKPGDVVMFDRAGIVHLFEQVSKQALVTMITESAVLVKMDFATASEILDLDVAKKSLEEALVREAEKVA